ARHSHRARGRGMVDVRSALVVLLAFAAGCGRSEPTRTDTRAPSDASSAPPAVAVYVTNEASGDLTVIDASSQAAIATIPLGKRPRGLAVSPDRSLLYVALSGSPAAGPGVD